MPPEATITACARSANSPTISRLLLLPRAAALGARIEPLTPSTAPWVSVERVDAVAKAEGRKTARGGRARAPLERLDDAGAGAPA